MKVGGTKRRLLGAMLAVSVVVCLAASSALLLGGCGSDEAGTSTPQTPTGGSSASGGSGGYSGDGGTTGSGGTGRNGTGGEAGSGGSTPINCVPSEAGQPVDDSCGVFVSATGDDQNAGTKASPKATITAALAAAGSKPVYVCAEQFTEQVTLGSSVALYGGLDCSNAWNWIGQTTQTQLTAAAGEIVLQVNTTATGSRIEDFDITAEDGAQPGESSIAVLVGQAVVEFERCDITAGEAVDGAEGATPVGTGEAGLDGSNGNPGCTSEVQILGGNPVTKDCGGSESSTGEAGGSRAPAAPVTTATTACQFLPFLIRRQTTVQVKRIAPNVRRVRLVRTERLVPPRRAFLG